MPTIDPQNYGGHYGQYGYGSGGNVDSNTRFEIISIQNQLKELKETLDKVVEYLEKDPFIRLAENEDAKDGS